MRLFHNFFCSVDSDFYFDLPTIVRSGHDFKDNIASDHQNCFINALDLSDDYGDGRNPLVLKSEFIMSLCEQIMSHDQLGAREKSIIDRCTSNIYREYVKTFRGTPPTLQDLCADLMKQKEPAAHEIEL